MALDVLSIDGATSATSSTLVVELAEAEYMVRASGYLKTLDDFRSIPLVTAKGGVPVLLKDVARVQMGPEMRRGIAELQARGLNPVEDNMLVRNQRGDVVDDYQSFRVKDPMGFDLAITNGNRANRRTAKPNGRLTKPLPFDPTDFVTASGARLPVFLTA